MSYFLFIYFATKNILLPLARGTG